MPKSAIGALFTAIAASCVFAGSAHAQAPFFGTWKLNVERSVYNPGPRAPADFVQYYQFEDLGNGQLRFILTAGPGAAGNLGLQVSVFRIDGQQHPVYQVPAITELIDSGETTNLTRSYRQINETTVEFTTYNDGVAGPGATLVRQMLAGGNSFMQRPPDGGTGNVLVFDRVR